MDNKRNLLFIINPVAGNSPQSHIPQAIKRFLAHDKFNYEIQFTREKGHAMELAAEGIRAGFNGIVAVGGDGTINEIGQSLIGTDYGMGIIPSGSGNGLARFLKIPMNLRRAIQVLNQQKEVVIDTGQANNNIFLVTAGVGFDAHVGKIFAASTRRGFGTYVQAVLSSFFTYKPKNYQLKADGELLETEAFAITIANAGQYGNNAYIAPGAIINDGFLDLCIIKPFPRYLLADMSLKLFRKTIDQSRFVSIKKITSLEIDSEDSDCYHLDGESFVMNQSLKLKVLPNSLRMMVPFNES